jgi:Acetyltransferases, including N-acetylases of ribosomal proteins
MEFAFKTERLLLRPFAAEDAPVLNRISNQHSVLKWMPDWEMDAEGTGRLIQYFISQYPLATKERARVMFAAELNGEVIGMVGIGNKKEADNEIETAYFISEQYAGMGYITEAVKAVTKWAIETLELAYIIAIVETDNYPSQKIVEKCGFMKLDKRVILNSGEIEEKPFYYYRLYKS